jgi:hypothetical protein
MLTPEDDWMKTLVSVLAVLLGFLVGCSGGLGRKTAGETIDKSLQGTNGRASFMRSAWLLVILGLLLGCTKGTLDRETAAEKINTHFSVAQRYLIFYVGRIGSHCSYMEVGGRKDEIDMNPAESIATVVAMKAGYVTVTPDGNGYWKVDLTDKGRAFMTAQHQKLYSHQVQMGCDFEQARFAIAKASVVRVTGVTTGEDSRLVGYQWKWAPTELGIALRENGDLYSKLAPDERVYLRENANFLGFSGPDLPIPVPPEGTTSLATAKFNHYDDGWRLE